MEVRTVNGSVFRLFCARTLTQLMLLISHIEWVGKTFNVFSYATVEGLNNDLQIFLKKADRKQQFV